MRLRNIGIIFTAATLAVLTAALSGCSGGSGGGNKNGEEAAQMVRSAQASLDSLLTRSQAPTAADIQAVRTAFAAAYQKDNNNAQAAFGFGLSDMAWYAQTIADLAGTQLGRSAGSRPSSPVTRAAQATLPWNLRNASGALTGKDLLLTTVRTPFALAESRQAGLPNPVVVRAALTQLKNALDQDIPLIAKANKPGFTFQIADYEDGEGKITIDQADVQFLLGAMHGLRAVAQAALAYDFNYGSFNPDRTVGDAFGNLPVGATVTPEMYLPPAPFGTLVNGGAAAIAGTRNDLNAAADTWLTFANTSAARSSQHDHLTDPLTGEERTEFRNSLNQLKAGLNGPITEDGVTYDVSAWLNNPPQSLRVFLPTYTVVQEDGGTFLRATGLPDPTFGGLITGGPNIPFENSVFGDQPITALLTGLGGE
jgi:hypothetical protein